MSPLRWLTVVSLAETASLVVLLTNLGTAHLHTITVAMGPLHGAAYLMTIAMATVLPVTGRTRALALIPGIGGLLVLRTARQRRDDASRRGESSPPQ